MTSPKVLFSVVLLFVFAGCSSKLDQLPQGDRLDVPTSESIVGIFFVDGETGYAATESGEGYTTVDGGKTFAKLNLNGGRVRDFCFLNDDIGFAFGPSGFLSRTEDGGSNWSQINTDTSYQFRDMMFLDKGHGFLVGEAIGTEGRVAGLIGSSTDKGLTWSFRSNDHGGLRQICTAAPSHVWILGNDGITYSVDKGVSWEYSRNHGDTVRAIGFGGIADGWSVGDNGLLRVTSNGGWSWTDKPKLTNRNLSCVATPALEMTFLGGDRFLGMTTSYGRIWLIDSLNYLTTFTDCQAVGKDVFFAGSGGTIIRLRR